MTTTKRRPSGPSGGSYASRKANGQTRVAVWLDEEHIERLQAGAHRHGSYTAAIEYAIEAIYPRRGERR